MGEIAVALAMVELRWLVCVMLLAGTMGEPKSESEALFRKAQMNKRGSPRTNFAHSRDRCAATCHGHCTENAWCSIYSACKKDDVNHMAAAAEDEMTSRWFLDKVAKKSLLSSDESETNDLASKLKWTADGKIRIARNNKKPVVVFVYGPSAAGK